MVANDDNLVLDVARNISHRVPNGSDLLIDCRHPTPSAQGLMKYRLNIGIPWLTSLTVRFAPPPCISLRIICALAQEIGKLGIDGMFSPSVRFASSYDGNPGVVGSPGYMERNCTEPRWTECGLRAGPCGYLGGSVHGQMERKAGKRR